MAVADELEHAREACARGAWGDAYETLASASGLAAGDVELLALTAYMLGRDPEYIAALERAHALQLDAGEPLLAARNALWIGMHLVYEGETGRGTGWIGRAQRLVEAEAADCVERGYMLLPEGFRREAMGDLDGAVTMAREAAAIAERFGERDLFALATHMQGHMATKAGRVAEGLPLHDEAMVAVTAGECSPIPSGLVYCGVILGCQAAFDARRAQEWTEALARWCERQPDMVAFSGACQVHRAQIMQLKGSWTDALEEARCAARRAARGNHRRALAEAAYVQGEVLRLRGDHGAAEAAYKDASGYGREPQPGLALLRLAQGNTSAAVAAIRRALGESGDPLERAKLLPACAEIMLAARETEEARAACEELARIASGRDGGLLGAIAAQTSGAVELATGDPATALRELRRAWRAWDEADAPYEAARVRGLMAEACRALGDDDAAALELEAARRTFADLGAATEIARLDGESASLTGLTARELEVLRLVAAGRTNKSIAAELVLSESTVDRHVSNIFAKLRVSSRAAATAYAYEHRLV